MRIHPTDRALLGIDPHGPEPLGFVVTPHLCRTDGRFYGGGALAASLVAVEAAADRPVAWTTTQLVGAAALGERIDLHVEVVASGRSVDQVSVQGRVGERLVFQALGAAATPAPEGMGGTNQVMPRVPPPEECPVRWGPSTSFDRPVGAAGPVDEVGAHLVHEQRDAPFDPSDPAASDPGRLALWARLTGDLVAGDGIRSAGAIGFVADMAPLAITRACGVEGAGTSLDNTLRVSGTIDADWVLLDVQAELAHGGFGHGRVLVWTPAGDLVAVASQTARLFSFEHWAQARAEGRRG